MQRKIDLSNDAPPLRPDACIATSSVAHQSGACMGDSVSSTTDGAWATRYTDGPQHLRRFGDARGFFMHQRLPPRPSSGQGVSSVAGVCSVEALERTCTPAVDPLELPPSKGAARPASALSVASVQRSVYPRPLSAISVTTRDLNGTVESVLGHFAEREAANAMALRKQRRHTASSSVGAFHLTSCDGCSSDDDRHDEHPRAAATSPDVATTSKAQTPLFLSKNATWKRLWRTRADEERERIRAIEEQVQRMQQQQHGGSSLRATMQSNLSFSTSTVGAKRSYVAGLIDEEHEESLLCQLRTHEKIEVLRKDPQKRKLFSTACAHLTDAIKREGDTVILRRKQRSAALLRQASNVGAAAQQRHQQQGNATANGPLAVVVGRSGAPLKAISIPEAGVNKPYFVSSDGETSSSDDSGVQTGHAERTFFAAASKVTHEMEKQRRGKAAIERCEMFRSARLIRAAEDIEKVDVLRSKHFADVQVEVRVNLFSTAAVLAAHMGSWLVAVATHWQQHAQPHPSSPTDKQTRSPVTQKQSFASTIGGGSNAGGGKLHKVVRACMPLLELRKQALLKVSARVIWHAWVRCRASVRAARMTRSIDLIKQFARHRGDTMRFVSAVNHYLSAVRYMQAWWRGTSMLRGLRHELALRQVQNFLKRAIHDDTQKAKTLKEECRLRECEIANRKGMPRLVKGQRISDLKRETEAEIAACHARVRITEALRGAPSVVEKIVNNALLKKHHDYHQQVTRYAKALASYDREVNALRERGVIILRRRKGSAKPSQQLAPVQKRVTSGMSSASGTPPPTQRSFVDSARRASSMDTSRRQTTNAAAQIDILMRGGKIYVDEPVSLQTAGGGSTPRGSVLNSARGQGVRNNRSSRVDGMMWALLKDRGIIGHIPVKPIQPFFHAVFHRAELLQMIETSSSTQE